MITLSSAISEISRIIQDESYTNDNILVFVNRAISQLVSETTPVSLILFNQEVTIDADNQEFDMPDDLFYPSIISVLDDSAEIAIPFYFRISDMGKIIGAHARNVQTREGFDFSIVFIGKKGYVYPKQKNSTTILVSYMRKPTLHESSSSTEPLIDFDMPEPFAEKAIIDLVCSDIYNEIEDGVDQKKTITNGLIARYLYNIEKIKSIIGNINRQAIPETVGGIVF